MKVHINEPSNSIIKVIGVGGGGSNAVNHMFKQGIVGVDFAICNTDHQAMDVSPVPIKIQLGPGLTEGRGAGSKPNIGREACIESLDDVKKFFSGSTKMLFITAGMGGGTGTGAAPVIAKAAQEMDILTVGIVTIPFGFEGRRRMQQAMEGIEELKKNVDTLIVISNDKLRQLHGNLSLTSAFAQADNILNTAAKGIAEIITIPGYVNVDFEDVNTVMRGSGVAVMGTAAVEGENRARRAVELALQSPLLEDNDIRGAKHILLNITSGTREVSMDEVFEITEYVQEEAGIGTDLIWGNCFDPSLGEKISVTLIATGFEIGRNKAKLQNSYQQNNHTTHTTKNNQPNTTTNPNRDRVRVSLDDDNFDNKPLKNTVSGKDIFNVGKEEIVDNSVVFEFDTTPKVENTSKYSLEAEEPYIKAKEEQREKEMAQAYRKNEERRNRLRNLSVKLNNPQTIQEMENVPAYLRRNINLDDVESSKETKMSKYTLSEDDEQPEFKKNNPFLFDNVD
jgi:cell division protein FtsZ